MFRHRTIGLLVGSAILLTSTFHFITSWPSLERYPIIGSAGALDVGRWGPIIPVGIVPVAAALLPQSGRVLIWAAERPDVFDAEGEDPNSTLTALYDVGTGHVSEVTPSTIRHGMFCPGLSMDAHGNPVVTGGKTSSRMSLYADNGNGWMSGPNLTVGRGYHAQVTLGNGDIFTIGGSWSGGIGGVEVAPKDGEIFDSDKNIWSSLPGCSVEPILTNGSKGNFESDNHAWLFSWSHNSVFQAGPSSAMNWFSTQDRGDHASAGRRGYDADSMNGNAVMYDASRGQILTLGGAPSYSDSPATNMAHIITLSSPMVPPKVEEVEPMHQPRAYANSVVLPTGDVFVNGGASFALQWMEKNTSWIPELWSPQTRSFKQLARSPVSRVYHSFALLLPDATILTGGGGMCYIECDDTTVNHMDVQIFSPPYLFESGGTRLAKRPRIIDLSDQNLHPGSDIQATTNVEVFEFSLVRYGAATHSINTDQRRIPLIPRPVSARIHGSRHLKYTLTIPEDPGVVVPGYWMLFAVDRNGVPSVAQTVHIRSAAV
jgi:galactose oxidase